ncbi:DUF2007 domain-containing protein [bacterium]|nr:DUF2007 domain-containing protein [bacterium]
MKTVYTATFQDDAIVILSILKSGGIEGMMMADNMLEVNPLFHTDIRGISIVVPDEQEEDARALVDDYRKRSSTTTP